MSDFRAIPADCFVLPQNRVLAVCRRTGRRAVVSSPAAEVLKNSFIFRSRDAHVRVLSTRLRREPGDVLTALAELGRVGFVEEKSDWVQRHRSHEPAPAKPVRFLGVVTRQTEDRWPTLERCLRSHAANATRWGQDSGLRIVVADDCGSAAVRKTVRHNVSSLASEFPSIRFSYLGHEEKQLSTGEDPDLQFLLQGKSSDASHDFGITTGANRNTLLRAAAGQSLAMVDDDEFCQLTPSGHATSAFRIGSEFSPGDTTLYFDAEDWDPPHADIDFFTEISRGLGPVLRPDMDWSAASASLETIWKLESEGAESLLVQAGVAGDSGTSTPVFNLLSMGRAQAKLQESDYRRLLLSRTTLRLPDQWTFTDGPGFMTMCCAIDNRVARLPFPPRGRNQDGIFAKGLRLLEPNSFTAFAPFAVRHLPPEARNHKAESLFTAPAPALNDLLSYGFDTLPNPGKGTDRQVRLSAWLEELSALEAPDFQKFMRQVHAHAMSSFIQRLEGLLKVNGSTPAFWAKDIQKLMRAYEKSIASPEPWTVVEQGMHVPVPAQQSYLRSFARGLRAWTDQRKFAITPE